MPGRWLLDPAGDPIAQSESGGFGDMLDAVEVPPPWFYNIAARLYTGLHVVERMERPFFNVLVSSVPGPPTPLYFGGARILGMHPFGPVYDGMLLNITVIGREDSLDLGLVGLVSRQPCGPCWRLHPAICLLRWLGQRRL